MNDELDEQLCWASYSAFFGAGYIHILAQALERGTVELNLDPSGWDNTMAAVEWAMGEILAGRLHGMQAIAEDDLDRLRTLRMLGSEAVAGGARSPSLPPLARQCLQALLGPAWRDLVLESERSVQDLATSHPRSGTS
jgi:hypothetical protein